MKNVVARHHISQLTKFRELWLDGLRVVCLFLAGKQVFKNLSTRGEISPNSRNKDATMAYDRSLDAPMPGLHVGHTFS